MLGPPKNILCSPKLPTKRFIYGVYANDANDYGYAFKVFIRISSESEYFRTLSFIKSFDSNLRQKLTQLLLIVQLVVKCSALLVFISRKAGQHVLLVQEGGVQVTFSFLETSVHVQPL